MIPNSVLQNLLNSPYFEHEYINKLNISSCKLPYEVFEKVFTKIAKEHNLPWRQILRSNNTDSKKFELLCICCILIDKLLRIEFRMTIEDRAVLLGNYKNEIVRYYYKYN